MRIYILALTTPASILACGAITAYAQTDCAQAPFLLSSRVSHFRQRLQVARFPLFDRL